MLSDETIKFIDKLAAEGSTGESQAKHKDTGTQRNYAGEGTGLGAIIGGLSGSMSKKYRGLITAGGALAGSAVGNYLGKKTIGKKVTHAMEKNIKKKDQSNQRGQANLPRLGLNKRLGSK